MSRSEAGGQGLLLGVVADDLTGATDIGSMSAKAGHLTHIFAYDSFDSVEERAASPVCILDTDSRLDDPQTAYDKVHVATRALQRAGFERFHKKTCSVFRGNVGAEFDAMLDALGEEFAMVVLGFPKNGRTTVGGVHYVNGARLEESPFRNDPVHPMSDSSLVTILGAQTGRRVAAVGHEVVARGPAELAVSLAKGRERGGYLIIDVVDQAALATIAAACERSDTRVLCGASGLIEELAKTWPPAPDPSAATRVETSLTGPTSVLLVAGSLTPQTQAQVANVRAAGVAVLTLDPLTVFSDSGVKGAVEALVDSAAEKLNRGEHVLVHADDRPEAVRETQLAGAELGHDRAATGRLVSQALARVARRCREQVGLTRLVVAGGDTSAAVCRQLGLTGFKVLAEVAPGVPACLSLAGDQLAAVFKSGSFGGPRFLLEAIAYLQEVE